MKAALLWLVVMAAGGCAAPSAGGSKAPVESQEERPAATSAPAAPEAEGQASPEPQTLEQAEAELARARSDLDSALGRLAFAEPPPPAQTSPTSPAAPAAGAAPRAEPKDDRRERASSADEAAEPSKAGAEKKTESGPTPSGIAPRVNCELACRAFGSLNRAAQAVCRLDGDGGERCGRARRVVADAQARVKSCSCPASP